MSKLGGGDNCGGICGKLGLKPVTKNNILYFYIPLQSLVSYAALSVNVMNPSVAIKLLPKRDVTNFLLIHTIFGTTLYIYSRPHLQSLPASKKAVFSLTGASLFTFGSVLVWAVIKSGLPKDNPLLTTALGLATGVAAIRISTDYFNHVDSLVAKN